MAARRGPLGCWLSAAAALGLAVLTVSVVLRSVGAEGGGDAGAPRAVASGPVLPPGIDYDLPPPPADAVALLEGLQPGQRVGALTVTGMAVTQDKRLVVRLGQSRGTGFSVSISTLAGDTREPPLKSERYKVFTGEGRDYDGPLDPAASSASLDNILQRLQRTEKTVPTPQGM